MKPRPERLVLLGHAIGHSLSPALQNVALRAAGIPLTYESLDVPRSALDETIETLRREGAAGNVTLPYKGDVLRACDRVSDTARAVGAVNTFWMAVDGALVGDNTDVGGFQVAVRELLGSPARGEVVALIGAGGAAAAVLHAIERWHGTHVRIYSRTRERAQQLVERFRVSAEVVSSAAEAVKGAGIVVNATPVGLRDDSVPVPVDVLAPKSAVLDLAYRAGETALVRQARSRGHKAMDGLTMLVEQGALAFELWFGIAPDRDAMWAAVRSQHAAR